MDLLCSGQHTCFTAIVIASTATFDYFIIVIVVVIFSVEEETLKGSYSRRVVGNPVLIVIVVIIITSRRIAIVVIIDIVIIEAVGIIGNGRRRTHTGWLRSSANSNNSTIERRWLSRSIAVVLILIIFVILVGDHIIIQIVVLRGKVGRLGQDLPLLAAVLCHDCGFYKREDFVFLK